MADRKRSTRLGNIRALCIFLVVLGHSIILYSSAWDLYSTEVSAPALDLMKKFIDPIQMPLFFSLSGYLFVFTHSKHRGFLSLLRAKALRLLVPYFGIGLMYMLPIRLAIGYPGYQGKTAVQLLTNFLMSSDVGHLWFLPALFVMFLLAELILTAAEKLPLVRRAPALFLCAAALGLYMEGYRISLGYAPIQSAYGNLLWFSLGYGLCAWRDLAVKIFRSRIVKLALAASAIGLLGLEILVAPMSVTMSLLARVLFIVSVYGIMTEKTCSVVEKVDRSSFGIYLFHSPLIYITFANIPNAHPAVVVFINLVVFGAAAYGLTSLVRKTKFRLLIGE